MKIRPSYSIRIGALLFILILFFSDVTFADDGVSRSLLKAGGMLGALLGLIGISIAGYLAGKSFDSYTGWERFMHGASMFFNREPFRKDMPTYEKVGKTRRIHIMDTLDGRMGPLMQLMMPSDQSAPKWAPPMGIEGLPEPLKGFFQENKESFNGILKIFQSIMKQREDWPKYATQFAIADAFSKANASMFEEVAIMQFKIAYPDDPKGPPEAWDFRGIKREKPLPFKSPEHASKLIKKMTYLFGATLVGITKLNPDWVYQGYLRGVGPGDFEVPAHWEYAIVFVTPHEWDGLLAGPVYGTSFDAYSRQRAIGGRLEYFLHELGYPARTNLPPFSYDLVMPPVAIDAGLGEQARNCVLITPELGNNSRLGCVLTNVPMAVDKPIDIGISQFCRKCKICADKCPSGAISHADEPGVYRGYKRWNTKSELCMNTWSSLATSYPGRACRICLTVCPYTRKNNWLHNLAKNIEARDPSGIVSRMLLLQQKTFFNYPEARDFMPPPEGKNVTYHEPPEWLKTEEWFDVKKTW